MIVNEPLDTLMRSVRGSNVVMHAATRNNVRVLFSSTSEVYGKQSHNGALTEEDDLDLRSPSKGRWTYAIAKTFGEALIHGYHRQRGTDATIVRLFNTVGPRQTGTYGMVLPRFVRQALAGEDLTVYGDGATSGPAASRTCVTRSRRCWRSATTTGRPAGPSTSAAPRHLISIAELARRVIERSGSASGIVPRCPTSEAYGSGLRGARDPADSDTAALRELDRLAAPPQRNG